MIRTILGFFGYVKVPQEVVWLAVDLEEGYRRLSKRAPSALPLYQTAQVITSFLKSGKLLNTK